ncbi:hypothetical protein WMY93_016487 [Mugilogobius chulae]|uniref:Uncharacterized protein n=1 Tax=Mugilogobius chulae TaxID=88201 RepID=A0AAW0NVP9_9GOBI
MSSTGARQSTPCTNAKIMRFGIINEDKLAVAVLLSSQLVGLSLDSLPNQNNNKPKSVASPQASLRADWGCAESCSCAHSNVDSTDKRSGRALFGNCVIEKRQSPIGWIARRKCVSCVNGGENKQDRQDGGTMMDELVQDLVLALEQSAEQTKLGELWEEMVFSPLQQRRQVRRRRAQRRHRDSSLYHYWLEASESSMDETSRAYRKNPATASVANCSDSDERSTSSHWHRVRRRPLETGHPHGHTMIPTLKTHQVDP